MKKVSHVSIYVNLGYKYLDTGTSRKNTFYKRIWLRLRGNRI